MTLLLPPSPPVDVTLAWPPADAIVHRVDPALLPDGRLDLDLIIGTNATLAPSRRTTGWVIPGAATTDGSSDARLEDSPSSWLIDLKKRTGLPYSELAKLVGVERRSLYFWLEGRAISPENRARLADVVAIARRLDRGNGHIDIAAIESALPATAASILPDRLARYRVVEGDASATLPFFDVATLLSAGHDDDQDRGDDGKRA